MNACICSRVLIVLSSITTIWIDSTSATAGSSVVSSLINDIWPIQPSFNEPSLPSQKWDLNENDGDNCIETKDDVTPSRIGVIGVPLRYGQNKDGPQLGPSVLRGPLFEAMRSAGCWYEDNGDVELQQSYELGESHDMYEGHNFGTETHFSSASQKMWNNSGCGNAMFPKTVASAVHRIERAVSRLSSAGQFPLTLGGDHAMVMATVQATGNVFKDLVVIHIDAHGDINTIKSSESGHIHGAPLSFVVQDEEFQSENADCLPFNSIHPVIKPTSLAFIGLRDLDPFEVQSIQRLNITAFTSSAVREVGAKEIVKRVFDIVNPDRKKPVHVSFDIDSLDPLYAPSTGTSVTNGLTKDDALLIAKEISQTGTLVALDVAEVNPRIRSEEASVTVQTAVDVTMAFLSAVCPNNPNGMKNGRRRNPSC